MLVIKKRSKLMKSLSAGIVMFAVGLTGSVAYLDATIPSGFVSEKDPSPLTKTGSAAGEAVANQAGTGEPSTDATSSSSAQPETVAAFAPAPAEQRSAITTSTSEAVAEQTVPVIESVPMPTTPEESPEPEPSLLEGVILPLLP